MKEIRHLKTIKNKRNLNTKWLLLQNDQNADTTLLHSHDEMFFILLLFIIFHASLPTDYCFVLMFSSLNDPNRNKPPLQRLFGLSLVLYGYYKAFSHMLSLLILVLFISHLAFYIFNMCNFML